MKIGIAFGAFVLILIVLIGGAAAAVAQALFGSSAPTSCATSPHTTVSGYEPDQIANATTIVAVGKQMNIPPQGWVVATAAAMQESGLHNVDHGDRDSLGLFQERPSQGWGTPSQIMDPGYSTTQFYRHLTAIPGWQQLSVNDAAQAVERSAFPNAYAQHQQPAQELVNAVQGATCANASQSPNPNIRAVVDAALSQVGVPYAWGGGTAAGPSPGTGPDAGKVGFDCSGLAVYAYAKVGVHLPHQTQSIWAAFQPAITNPTDIQPGDLVMLSSNGQPSGIHHLGIYLGAQQGGQVVNAPESGETVRVASGIWTNQYWRTQFIGAVRPDR